MDKLVCEKRVYTDKPYTHFHDFSQLVLPLEGSVTITTSNDEYKVNRDSVFFLPPQCSHSYYSNSKNECMIADIPHGYNNLFSLEDSEVQFQQANEKWNRIKYLLLEEYRDKNLNGLTYLVNYIIDLLTDTRTPRSIKFIHKNLDKPLYIKDLAAMESYNENYYIDWFTKQTGKTPNTYIKELRLNMAKEYLIDTDMSLLNIAQLVGYEYQSSLTRLFKQYEGQTPNAFRRHMRNCKK